MAKKEPQVIQLKSREELIEKGKKGEKIKELQALRDNVDKILELYAIKSQNPEEMRYDFQIKVTEQLIDNAIQKDLESLPEFKAVYATIKRLNDNIKKLEKEDPEKFQNDPNFTEFAKKIHREIDGISIENSDGNKETKYGRLGTLYSEYQSGFTGEKEIETIEQIKEGYKDKNAEISNRIKAIDNGKAYIDIAFERDEINRLIRFKQNTNDKKMLNGMTYTTESGKKIKLSDTIKEPDQLTDEEKKAFDGAISGILGVDANNLQAIEFDDDGNFKVTSRDFSEDEISKMSEEEKREIFTAKKDEYIKRIENKYGKENIETEIDENNLAIIIKNGDNKVVKRFKELATMPTTKIYTRNELKEKEVALREQLPKDIKKNNKYQSRADKTIKQVKKDSINPPEILEYVDPRNHYMTEVTKESKFRRILNKIFHPIAARRERLQREGEEKFDIGKVQDSLKRDDKTGLYNCKLNEEQQKAFNETYQKIIEGKAKQTKSKVDPTKSLDGR